MKYYMVITFLSVSDVTLKLESAVAPFEFQSHVSEPTLLLASPVTERMARKLALFCKFRDSSEGTGLALVSK
jgi:hypothetical protein